MSLLDTTVPSRRGTGCVKWDLAPEGVIPMWVADMDFNVAPFIVDALQRRLDHHVYGYTHVQDSYYQAIIDWFGRRRSWKIEKDWIMYIPGVVPAISCTVKAFTEPGDKVLFNTPAYNCFFSSVRNMGCEIVPCPLLDKGGRFEMDWDDFEAKVSDPAVKLYILCNPHNPTGRMWTREELVRIGEICRAHGVVVASDEIHCELEMPGNRFIPFASVSAENQECSVTFNSPSKAFNIAGLQIANIICSNAAWRERIDRAINVSEVCDVNLFGPVALEAAYSLQGEKWLDEVNAAIWRNYEKMRDAFREHLPHLPVTSLEGTYLVWIDCHALQTPTEEIKKKLIEENKVWINPGGMYGDDKYMRVNLAAPAELFDEGLRRMVEGLQKIK